LAQLVSLIKQNIATFSLQNNVFQCLRALLKRKFIAPEIYDIIEQVQELMVTSVQQNVRQVCSSSLLIFLMEYPLEATRFQQHFGFLMRNLSYFDKEGRGQVLQSMEQLVGKMAGDMLE